MSTGLIALLDDIVGIAKVAAASLDDVAAQAAKTGAKSAGVVIDDAAVTPRYLVGFAAARELPIVAKIARGSLKNKLLYLLPAALLLSVFAPWVITPVLMLGGLYLSYEGAEKVYEMINPHAAHGDSHDDETAAADAKALEDQKVSSAIKTDFILSAEIMAIALSTVSSSPLVTQALVLGIVGIGITLVVYGAVALIVKADDVGLALAGSDAEGTLGDLIRGFGRWIVKVMPYFLKGLATVGTVAMLWVGGGIIIHGLASFGLAGPEHFIHDIAVAVAGAAPEFLHGAVEWFVTAVFAAIVGLVVGAAMIPVTSWILAPAANALKSIRG